MSNETIEQVVGSEVTAEVKAGEDVASAQPPVNPTADLVPANPEQPPAAAPVQTAPVTPEVATVKKPLVTIPMLAEAIIAAIPDLAVRATKASGYRVLVTSVSGDDTYKKGIFFQVDGGQKALNFKLQLSYNKWCNWLTAHVPTVKALAVDGLTWAKDRDVGYLTAKLPMTMTLEEMVEKVKGLYEKLNPTVLAIRALAPAPVVKKEEAPAQPPANPAAANPAPANPPEAAAPAIEPEAAAPANPPVGAPEQQPPANNKKNRRGKK